MIMFCGPPVFRWVCPRATATVPDRPIGHDPVIRSSGHIVQDCPLRSVGWADIPPLSTGVRRCLPPWQQYWQQSRLDGLVTALTTRGMARVPPGQAPSLPVRRRHNISC
jgi:hypothetical protein